MLSIAALAPPTNSSFPTDQHLRNDDGCVCCGGWEQCGRDIREEPYEPSGKDERGVKGPLDGSWYNTTVRGADPLENVEWDEAVYWL